MNDNTHLVHPGSIPCFTNFVGIDISKFKLDICLLDGTNIVQQQVIPNNCGAIGEWLQTFRQLPGNGRSNTLFCMENTGCYGNYLLFCLAKAKAHVVVENAVHIKLSMGFVREKNDKVDALRIANFARKNYKELKLWVPRRAVLETLTELSTLRDRLLTVAKLLKTPLREKTFIINKKLQRLQEKQCKKSMQALQNDLKNTERSIRSVIQNDENLQRINKLLLSVPGIGPLTSLHMIMTTNEFRAIICPKKFACYAGIAPFKNQSGKVSSRARVSPFANKKMKSLLHMGSMKAIVADEELRNYYLRKTGDERKPKMLVLNAIRNKIILRAFACVKQNRPFIRDLTALADKKAIMEPSYLK